MPHPTAYLAFDGDCAEAMRFYERIDAARVLGQGVGDAGGSVRRLVDRQRRVAADLTRGMHRRPLRESQRRACPDRICVE